MNKTVTANIGNRSFSLNENAFIALNNYIANFRKKLYGENDIEEIMDDIESRIGELLADRLNGYRTIVDINDINFIIATIGYDDCSDHEPQESSSRKLYRDPDNRIISGVCSGLSNYAGIDPLIIRILALIFIGTSIFVYIVLMIAVPEATTPQQKREMKRGKRFDSEELTRRIKSEADAIRKHFNQYRNRNSHE